MDSKRVKIVKNIESHRALYGVPLVGHGSESACADGRGSEIKFELRIQDSCLSSQGPRRGTGVWTKAITTYLIVQT